MKISSSLYVRVYFVAFILSLVQILSFNVHERLLKHLPEKHSPENNTTSISGTLAATSTGTPSASYSSLPARDAGIVVSLDTAFVDEQMALGDVIAQELNYANTIANTARSAVADTIPVSIALHCGNAVGSRNTWEMLAQRSLEHASELFRQQTQIGLVLHSIHWWDCDRVPNESVIKDASVGCANAGWGSITAVLNTVRRTPAPTPAASEASHAKPAAPLWVSLVACDTGAEWGGARVVWDGRTGGAAVGAACSEEHAGVSRRMGQGREPTVVWVAMQGAVGARVAEAKSWDEAGLSGGAGAGVAREGYRSGTGAEAEVQVELQVGVGMAHELLHAVGAVHFEGVMHTPTRTVGEPHAHTPSPAPMSTSEGRVLEVVLDVRGTVTPGTGAHGAVTTSTGTLGLRIPDSARRCAQAISRSAWQSAAAGERRSSTVEGWAREWAGKVGSGEIKKTARHAVEMDEVGIQLDGQGEVVAGEGGAAPYAGEHTGRPHSLLSLWRTRAETGTCGDGAVAGAEECEGNNCCGSDCRYSGNCDSSDTYCCYRCEAQHSTQPCLLNAVAAACNGTGHCVHSICRYFSGLTYCGVQADNTCLQMCRLEGTCRPATEYTFLGAPLPGYWTVGTGCSVTRNGVCVVAGQKAAVEAGSQQWGSVPTSSFGRQFTTSATACALRGYQWRAEAWGECSGCEGGARTRRVWCSRIPDGSGNPVAAEPSIWAQRPSRSVAPDSRCVAEAQPARTETCNRACVSEWRVNGWGGCEGLCGQGTRRRRAVCVREDGVKVDASVCGVKNLPQGSWIAVPINDTDGSVAAGAVGMEQREACALGSACEVTWAASVWGECGRTCVGAGQQARTVWCVLRNTPEVAVHNDHCHGNATSSPTAIPAPAALWVIYEPPTQPPNRRLCVSRRGCTLGWRTGSWGVCKSICSQFSGVRDRAVSCLLTLADGAEIEVEADACSTATAEGYYEGDEWVAASPHDAMVVGDESVPAALRGVRAHGALVVRSGTVQTAPAQFELCSAQASMGVCAFAWATGDWDECSAVCGAGIQTRQRRCLLTAVEYTGAPTTEEEEGGAPNTGEGDEGSGDGDGSGAEIDSSGAGAEVENTEETATTLTSPEAVRAALHVLGVDVPQVGGEATGKCVEEDAPTRPCTNACTLAWEVSEWSACPAACAQQRGTRTRAVRCVKRPLLQSEAPEAETKVELVPAVVSVHPAMSLRYRDKRGDSNGEANGNTSKSSINGEKDGFIVSTATHPATSTASRASMDSAASSSYSRVRTLVAAALARGGPIAACEVLRDNVPDVERGWARVLWARYGCTDACRSGCREARTSADTAWSLKAFDSTHMSHVSAHAGTATGMGTGIMVVRRASRADRNWRRMYKQGQSAKAITSNILVSTSASEVNPHEHGKTATTKSDEVITRARTPRQAPVPPLPLPPGLSSLPGGPASTPGGPVSMPQGQDAMPGGLALSPEWTATIPRDGASVTLTLVTEGPRSVLAVTQAVPQARQLLREAEAHGVAHDVLRYSDTQTQLQSLVQGRRVAVVQSISESISGRPRIANAMDDHRSRTAANHGTSTVDRFSAQTAGVQDTAAIDSRAAAAAGSGDANVQDGHSTQAPRSNIPINTTQLLGFDPIAAAAALASGVQEGNVDLPAAATTAATVPATAMAGGSQGIVGGAMAMVADAATAAAVEVEGGEVVADMLCGADKPAVSETCSGEGRCAFTWVYSPWGFCDAECAQIGTIHRLGFCVLLDEIRAAAPAFDPNVEITAYSGTRLQWDGTAWVLPETRLVLEDAMWAFSLELGSDTVTEGGLGVLRLSGSVLRADGTIEKKAAASVRVWSDEWCMAEVEKDAGGDGGDDGGAHEPGEFEPEQGEQGQAGYSSESKPAEGTEGLATRVPKRDAHTGPASARKSIEAVAGWLNPRQNGNSASNTPADSFIREGRCRRATCNAASATGSALSYALVLVGIMYLCAVVIFG